MSHLPSFPLLLPLVCLAFFAPFSPLLEAAGPTPNTSPRLYRDRVQPHWFDDHQQFWYLNHLPGDAREFIRVDTRQGQRRPAFDHTALAQALSLELNQPVHPRQLPIDSIDFPPPSTDLLLHGPSGSWRWCPETLGLTRIDPPQPTPTPSPSRRRPPAHTDSTEIASPDGQWIAWVRDDNLWLRHVPSTNETQLTFDANPAHSFRRDTSRDRLVGMDYQRPEAPPTLPEVYWSPDSQRLIAVQTRSIPERRVHLIESAPTDQLQPRTSSYPYLKPGDALPTPTLRAFTVQPPKELPVDASPWPQPWSLEEFRWAPDSSRFSFLYHERGHARVRLIALDWSTGAPRTQVIIDESSPTFVDYSNKTYVEHLDATGEVLWMSERSGWNHLFLVDAHTGAFRHAVTSGPWVVRRVEHLDRESRQIWFWAGGLDPAQDPYHLHLARVNLDGSNLTLLTHGDGTHRVQWSPDRRFFLDTWSRVDLPPVTVLRRASDGTLVCPLEEADATRVLAANGRFPTRFVAPGRDGLTPIWGVLHWPRTLLPGQTLPVVENIYAGPHDHHVPKRFSPTYRHQQEIANRGFVVVQIDGMGTNWRSKAFHDVAWKNLADAGLPDRIAWLQAAARHFPELDLSRVGIYGGSAGGQNALAAVLFHGDFYRAAVADCGCHDNRLDKIWWNEAWMGWPVGPHYAQNSNRTHAHRLQSPLLLVLGELDRNVDPASTLQVVDALVRADKDFDFLLIPGAGHGAAETDYGRRRRADFLVRHLQSTP